MEQIIEGVKRFQREVFPKQKELYSRLTHTQHPTVLFISCADSRIIPELLTQQNPGELFVVRNAGNLVPSYSPIAGGVSASIEYAVAVLGVRDIIICGHSDCGAMKAILEGGEALKKLPAVARWIQHADAAKAVVCSCHGSSSQGQQLSSLVRENVLAQIANLRTHPSVAARLATNELHLHGWVFDIESGHVETFDAKTRSFVPLGQSHQSAQMSFA